LRRWEIKPSQNKSQSDAGVPVVPGSTGEIEDPEEAASIAKDIGYPVLLKSRCRWWW
jgi:biotin carboxylase